MLFVFHLEIVGVSINTHVYQSQKANKIAHELSQESRADTMLQMCNHLMCDVLDVHRDDISSRGSNMTTS